ncbi:DUF423 domain-containing protein [Desulforhopalus sp. IMCC35007]|uniref:DUF423 domain-containing protein n=1 Tax=Desulforhopalus sp. IMCC35007 TaxID=2569543 RepID=UPI0010ADFBE6|nr:DUF423 domain-containing protein [Desulforhopalus sp. IMCC35007]TKB10002.1 DUF423 domain-containing protein [Desulforhopalus sp. IMCC35007]
MVRLLITSGGVFALIGIVTRSLSSHAIKAFLFERGKLDNFNLAADYLVLHGLALIAVAILYQLFPDAKFQRAGWAFITGTLLFQGSVLIKSCISIAPFGFITPLGGFFLMLGWTLVIVSGFFACSPAS